MSNNVVVLNVGSTMFVTTRSTLTSKDGFFARLWSGTNWADAGESTGTQDNPLFIDRDPLAFPGVLSYLRAGKAILGSDDTVYLQKLAVEADFYMLSGLSSAIADELANRAQKLLKEHEAVMRGPYEWNVVDAAFSVRGPRMLMVIKRPYPPAV